SAPAMSTASSAVRRTSPPPAGRPARAAVSGAVIAPLIAPVAAPVAAPHDGRRLPSAGRPAGAARAAGDELHPREGPGHPGRVTLLRRSRRRRSLDRASSTSVLLSSRDSW